MTKKLTRTPGSGSVLRRDQDQPQLQQDSNDGTAVLLRVFPYNPLWRRRSRFTAMDRPPSGGESEEGGSFLSDPGGAMSS